MIQSCHNHIEIRQINMQNVWAQPTAGHVGIYIITQQDDAVSLPTHLYFVLIYSSWRAWHDWFATTVSLRNLSSRSRGALTSKNRVNIALSVDGCDLIPSVRVKCKISTACLLVFPPGTKNGDTRPHLLPQSTNETQYCTAADVLVILMWHPCLVGPTTSATCDMQDPIRLHAQHWQIQFHRQQQTVWSPSSCNVLCISENGEPVPILASLSFAAWTWHMTPTQLRPCLHRFTIEHSTF
jgi:hypothetical protein